MTDGGQTQARVAMGESATVIQGQRLRLSARREVAPYLLDGMIPKIIHREPNHPSSLEAI